MGKARAKRQKEAAPAGQARRPPGQIRGRVRQGAPLYLGRLRQALGPHAPGHHGLFSRVESPAEADILLRPAKKALEIKGISTTRSAQTPLKSRIPVRTHFDRDAVRPGQFAFDTVAHWGGSASRQLLSGNRAVQFPDGGLVAEKKRKNAAFVFSVRLLLFMATSKKPIWVFGGCHNFNPFPQSPAGS